jgi:hypothetical protein
MRAACFGTGPINPFSTVETYGQNHAMPGMSDSRYDRSHEIMR